MRAAIVPVGFGGLARLPHSHRAMGGIEQDQERAGGSRAERLAPFINGPVLHVNDGLLHAAEASATAVIADRCLQNVADYRVAIRSWFSAVREGGHLIISVPHAFLDARQLDLPVRARPEERRLYSPASLLDEIEQALSPNSYRVRLLFDDDGDYDYAALSVDLPTGRGDIVLVLEKLAAPLLALHSDLAGTDVGPDYAFEPERTRTEIASARPRRRVLILKLDHLGDFIIGLPALERARALFADAHLTLVVGSWNLELAQSLGLADEVRAFDAFPRNSAHEEPDVVGKRGLFEAAFPDTYDVAIDLRTDGDTRILLERASAPIKAAIGAKAYFPFLDIALPIDIGRIDREDAREWRYEHGRFYSQAALMRGHHRIKSKGDTLDRATALVWGPYDKLRPGRYIFDPFLEIAPDAQGLILIDIALDTERVAQRIIAVGDATRLSFDVTRDESAFEFRVWALEDTVVLPFSFYGGRLVREGAPGTVHQSDYLMLLIELIALRLHRFGLLEDIATR